MEHQDMIIPEHLREEWERVNRWIGEASIRLVEANQDYHKAIVARIALSAQLQQ